MAGHLLVLACFLLFLRLGWWQWQVSRSARGSFQNLGYALQWPFFAFFALFAWIRILRDTIHPRQEQRQEQKAAASGEPPPPAYRRPTRVALAPDDADDPELAAYNQYLAWLNAGDQPG